MRTWLSQRTTHWILAAAAAVALAALTVWLLRRLRLRRREGYYDIPDDVAKQIWDACEAGETIRGLKNTDRYPDWFAMYDHGHLREYCKMARGTFRALLGRDINNRISNPFRQELDASGTMVVNGTVPCTYGDCKVPVLRRLFRCTNETGDQCCEHQTLKNARCMKPSTVADRWQTIRVLRMRKSKARKALRERRERQAAKA